MIAAFFFLFLFFVCVFLLLFFCCFFFFFFCFLFFVSFVVVFLSRKTNKNETEMKRRHSVNGFIGKRLKGFSQSTSTTENVIDRARN